MLSIYEKDDVFAPGEEYRRMRNMYASPSQVLTDMVLKLVRGKYAPNVPTAKLPKYAKTNNRPKSYYDLSELLVSPLYRKTMCRYLQQVDQDVSTSYGSAFIANWRQRSTFQRSDSIGSSVSTAVPPLESNQELRVRLSVVGNNGGTPCFTVSDPYLEHPNMPPLNTPPVTQIQASPPSQYPRPKESRTMGTQTARSGAKSKPTQTTPDTTGSMATQTGSSATVSQDTQTDARIVTNNLQEMNSRNDEVRELTQRVSELEQKLGEADAAATTRCAMLSSEILELNGQLELANKYKEEAMENLIQLQKELEVKVAKINELVDAKDAGVDVNIMLRKDLTQAETDLQTAETTLSYLRTRTIQQSHDISELEQLVEELRDEADVTTADASTMANIPIQPNREPAITASLAGTGGPGSKGKITRTTKGIAKKPPTKKGSTKGTSGAGSSSTDPMRIDVDDSPYDTYEPMVEDDPMNDPMEEEPAAVKAGWYDYVAGAFQELRTQLNELAVDAGRGPIPRTPAYTPLSHELQMQAAIQASNVLVPPLSTHVQNNNNARPPNPFPPPGLANQREPRSTAGVPRRRDDEVTGASLNLVNWDEGSHPDGWA